VTIVDAEELGGAMTDKLAELFDEQAAAAEDQRVPVRKPDRWSRASATFLDPPDPRRA
jgi:cobaltochelatase CobT